jgi:nitronate monooxygenase
VGVGVIGWIAEMTESSDDPRIPTILDELPVAIWFAFGVDLGKYVEQVRRYDARRQHKTLIFVIVNSVAEALRAAIEWRVDVIVAQGDDPVISLMSFHLLTGIQALRLEGMAAPSPPRCLP